MPDEKERRTELSELGEFGLIQHLTADIRPVNPSTLRGVGDDAAVIGHGETVYVVTTDLLAEGVHFNLMYVPLRHLGYKAVVVNLSDVYAMNAGPTQVTVSLALSNRFSVEAVEELYSGMRLACKKYKVDIVGGDTTSSLSGLVISITAIGEARRDELVYRSGAGVNDLLCVTGDLGGAYIGLQLLEREKEVFSANPDIQPDLAGNDYVLARQLKPEARADVIGHFREWKIRPTSMIDISDGLSSEIIHLCKSSGKGCRLYEAKIPIDPSTCRLAAQFNLDPTLCALNGGEDYELLFTVAPADYDKIKDHPDFTVIGHMTDVSEGMNIVSKSDTVHPLTAQGWDALLKKSKVLSQKS